MYIVCVVRYPFRLYVQSLKNGIRFSSNSSDAMKFSTYAEADSATWGLGKKNIIKLEDVT